MTGLSKLRLVGAAILLLALQFSSLAGAQTQSRILLQHGAVHGFRHYDGKAVWNEMKVHDLLSLVREPENPYDAKAVRVDWQGHKLGYVPRDDNVDLARLIDNGNRVEARITQLTKGRRPNNRVQLEIYLPMEASPEK
jgi:HIRAN domain